MSSDDKVLVMILGLLAVVGVVEICSAAFSGDSSTAEPGCYTSARNGDKCVTVRVDKSRHAVATPVACETQP